MLLYVMSRDDGVPKFLSNYMIPFTTLSILKSDPLLSGVVSVRTHCDFFVAVGVIRPRLAA